MSLKKPEITDEKSDHCEATMLERLHSDTLQSKGEEILRAQVFLVQIPDIYIKKPSKSGLQWCVLLIPVVRDAEAGGL